jgi:hypothetical protein
MSESQPPESGLSASQRRAPVDQPEVPQQRSPSDLQPQVPRQYDPQGFQPPPQVGAAVKTGFTAAEGFWYLLGNIAFGAMYLRKVPAKKALSEFGLAEMTSAEKAWYTFLCVLCGAGYFAKLPVAKAISETPPFVASRPGLTDAGRFWYLLGCLAYGASYFAKVSAKKALSDFGLAELNSAEANWYTIVCIACGLGYFAKIPTAKAVSEMNPPCGTGTLVARSPQGPHAALAQTEERRTRNA